MEVVEYILNSTLSKDVPILYLHRFSLDITGPPVTFISLVLHSDSNIMQPSVKPLVTCIKVIKCHYELAPPVTLDNSQSLTAL